MPKTLPTFKPQDSLLATRFRDNLNEITDLAITDIVVVGNGNVEMRDGNLVVINVGSGGGGYSRGGTAETPATGHVFAVTLTKTGGVSGSKTAICTWVYTVTSKVTGESVGTSVSPEAQRPTRGKIKQATVGVAYFTSDGALKLQLTDEVFEVEAC
jgi:hypothetical protein